MGGAVMASILEGRVDLAGVTDGLEALDIGGGVVVEGTTWC